MLAASGYVSVQDPDLCIGCGVCVEFCQFAAIAMADGPRSSTPQRAWAVAYASTSAILAR